jgi:hypothetical protein
MPNTVEVRQEAILETVYNGLGLFPVKVAITAGRAEDQDSFKVTNSFNLSVVGAECNFQRRRGRFILQQLYSRASVRIWEKGVELPQQS